MIDKNYFYIFVRSLASNFTYLIKLLTKLLNKKPNNLGNSRFYFLNKVRNKQTYLTNKWLIIAIFVFCFIVTIITYYEQKYSYINQLKDNSNLIAFSLNKSINTYKESLEALSYNHLWKNSALSENEISQIIKSTKSNRLANVLWHPNDRTNKSFGIYGIVKHQLIFQNICRSNQFAHTKENFTIQEYLDHNHQLVLLMLHKVVDEEQKIYGYLSLPINLISFLEEASSRILANEVIKLNNEDNYFYYDKYNQIFHLEKGIADKFYIFSKNIKLDYTPYFISLGVSYKFILEKVFQTLYSRYLLIIALGSILIFVYNLLERRKAKKVYQNAFAQEIDHLQNKLELGIKQQENLHILQQRLDSIMQANKILCNIQLEINHDIKSTLKLLDGTNEFLLKHCSGEKELEPEVIKKLFLTARNLLNDLSNNIYSKNNEYSQISLDALIDEITMLFFPIINNRSLTINKKINKLAKNTYITSNKAILEQIIINILLRSICSVIEGSEIHILIEKKDKTIMIKITDDGFVADEKLFRSIATENNSYLSIANLYLDLDHIKELVLSIGVSLEVNNHSRSGNKYILVVPINFHQLYSDNDKVIPFNKIAYLRQS